MQTIDKASGKLAMMTHADLIAIADRLETWSDSDLAGLPIEAREKSLGYIAARAIRASAAREQALREALREIALTVVRTREGSPLSSLCEICDAEWTGESERHAPGCLAEKL